MVTLQYLLLIILLNICSIYMLTNLVVTPIPNDVGWLFWSYCNYSFSCMPIVSVLHYITLDTFYS